MTTDFSYNPYTFLQSKRPFVVATLALLPALGWAEVKVCNQYAESVYTAIAYQRTEGVTTEGWWRVDSGQCTVVFDQRVNVPFYVHAHTEWQDNGDRRVRQQWGRNLRLAVSRDAFRYREAQQVRSGDESEVFSSLNDAEVNNGRSYDIEYTIEADGVNSTTSLRAR